MNYLVFLSVSHHSSYLSGSVNENQRTSSSYNGDLNGLLVPDPTAAGDGSSLTKPIPQTVPLGALQDKQVM